MDKRPILMPMAVQAAECVGLQTIPETHITHKPHGYVTRVPNTHRVYSNAGEVLRALNPEVPVHLHRPQALRKTVSAFLSAFDTALGGMTMYAVKSNPNPMVIEQMWACGVRAFDVASLNEVKLVRGLCPQAMLAFMHPVKSPAAIRAAYFDYGVRTFVLDCVEELEKILEATDNALDLCLVVRLGLKKGNAKIDLSAKFGAFPPEAVHLLQLANVSAPEIGVSFHVGSQCEDPTAFERALQNAADIVKQADIELDVLDVGGGFPAPYPGMTPPDLGAYMAVIQQEVAKFEEFKTAKLWAEPGRSLVADSGSVLTRVELRKGDILHLNDGTYGSLFDAGIACEWRYPVRVWRDGKSLKGKKAAFSFYGPTCDSLDAMKGPFMLPEGVKTGDWIEVGQLGAYGQTMRTNFNGFGEHLEAQVHDQPFK